MGVGLIKYRGEISEDERERERESMKFIIEVAEYHIHVSWESRVGVVRVEVPNDNLTT